jgi:hypothetical protein
MNILYFKRIVFSICLISIAFLSLDLKGIVAREVEDYSVIDGVFSTKNFNNLAEFSNFDIFAYDGTTYGTPLESGETLIPLQQYKLALTIVDQDTIADLESVEIRFWYSGSTETFDSNTHIDMSGNSFVIKWIALTNILSVVSLEGMLEETSWQLISSKTPELTELNEISYTFEVEFVISKVAPRSTLTQWHVGAIIEDGRMSVEESEKMNVETQTIVSKLNIASTLESGFNMAFYGEVILPEQAQFMWEDVSAGTRFSDDMSQTLTSITFISNDTYQSQIKSSEIWDAVLTQEQIDRIGLTPTDEIAIMLSLNVDSLVGVTYHDFNVAMEASILIYDSVYLPGIEGDNLTGAMLSTLETFLDDEKQMFSIGFSDFEASDGLGHTHMLSTFTTFETVVDASRERSNELGKIVTLILTLALSDYFQNARYEGVLTINITNITP